MTLDELQQLVDKDLKLDDTELDTESARIPLLHNKYLQHFNKFSLLQKQAQQDFNTLEREKWEYYTGKADESVYREKPFDLKVLKDIIKEEVEERFDHKNLNLDCPEFENLNPSAENIAVVIYDLLRGRLDKCFEIQVRLYETERNFVEYPV